MRRDFPDVHLLANNSNENYARGTNQALEAATGDLLLLLNPDVVVTPGALDTLAAFFDDHPEAGAVAPKLVHPDGRTQASVRGFPDPASLLWDIVGLARVFEHSRVFGAYRQTFFDYESAGPAPQPMASCFLITRRAYETIGPLDAARFPLFFNDADWCLRAWRAKLSVWYTPAAVVVHKGGASTRLVRRAAVWESHRALLRFYDKHYKTEMPRPAFALITILVTLGAWARTKYWGKPLGRRGGDATTTPEDLHRELERSR